MKGLLTVSDVLSDIEFELVQGSISRDELGHSIQRVRKYQNEIRGETIQSVRQAHKVHEAISRQFQINDMLITLLQEMAAELRSMQLMSRRIARISRFDERMARVASTPATGHEAVSAEEVGPFDSGGLSEDLQWWPTADVEQVENAMRSEALQVRLDVHSTGIPVVGGLMKRLRVALHNLALFYVDRLARQQAAINQTYGNWILRLVQLCQQQQEQIDLLNTQVNILQARLIESEQ